MDKNVEIRIGGRIQNDWNFIRPSDEIEKAVHTDSDGETSEFWPDAEPLDRIFFRRSRIFIRGTLHQYIRFKAEYDFAGGNVSWTDVYLRFVKLPAFGNIYVGKFKAPFGLEELTSSRFITFQERSLTDAFVPGRQVGILFKNSTWPSVSIGHSPSRVPTAMERLTAATTPTPTSRFRLAARPSRPVRRNWRTSVSLSLAERRGIQI